MEATIEFANVIPEFCFYLIVLSITALLAWFTVRHMMKHADEYMREVTQCPDVELGLPAPFPIGKNP